MAGNIRILVITFLLFFVGRPHLQPAAKNKTEAVMKNKMRIGVMGPGDASPEIAALAEEVGRLIAEAGAVLVCGGLCGAMEAASRGAHNAGGLVIGILPGSSARDANPFVDIPIVTDMGHARNAVNVLTSDAIIAVGGAYGTLSEIALALKCGKPVVALRSWDLRAAGCGDPLFHTAETPAEAVGLALRLARS